MAILDHKQIDSNSGFKKTINEGSLEMILDNLQVTQYRFPTKSTVRELCNNAIDSNIEKRHAIEILTNKAKEEDYYIRREGDMYKDSNFNPAYYNLECLSPCDKVYVTYVNTYNRQERDYFTVRDNGVGLGDHRLFGYTSLSYSTKRNSTKTTGKFGIGAKAPLSTGCDSFIMESVHNNRRFRLEIYVSKIDSLIPRWAEDGTENEFIEFENGFKCYYEKTEHTNYVEVKVPVKKHKKHEFIDAVKSQMLYRGDYIIFNEKFEDEYGKWREQSINFAAKIIYEDDNIVLSDNPFYSKPHIIINKTCYGFIDFQELELENKNGNIGIVIDPAKVDISQSREDVQWSTRTKEEITRKYELVVKTTENFIQEAIQGKTFFEWLKVIHAIKRKTGNVNPLISRLSNLIDIKTIDVSYSKNVDYLDVFKDNLSKRFKFIMYAPAYDSKKRKEVPTKMDVKGHGEFVDCNQFSIKTTITSRLVSKYLAYTHKRFILMEYKHPHDVLDPIMIAYWRSEATKEETLKALDGVKPEDLIDPTTTLNINAQEYRDTLLKGCRIDLDVMEVYKTLPGANVLYDQIAVPEGFKIPDETSEEGEDDDTLGDINAEQAKIAARENYKAIQAARRAAGKIVVATPNINYSTSKRTFSSFELLASDLNEDNTYLFGFKEDEPYLNFLAQTKYYYKDGPDTELFGIRGVHKIVRIAKNNYKYFADNQMNIKDFLIVNENGKIKTNPITQQWLRGYILSCYLPRISCLESINPISEELFADYLSIQQEYEKYPYAPLLTQLAELNFLMKCADMQMRFIEKDRDEHNFIITKDSLEEHFGKDCDLIANIKEIEVVPFDFIYKLEKLYKFVQTMPLIDPILRGMEGRQTPEYEKAVKEYIEQNADKLELEYEGINK